MVSAWLSFGLHAQVIPTPDNAVVTDSINLAGNATRLNKSPAIAMTASLILPGSGHQYLGRNTPALIYYSIDAAAIFGYFFCSQYAKKLAVDAAGYAWIHSGAQGSVTNAEDSYWNNVGSFQSSADYNTVMDLNRTPNQKISDPNQVWHWDDQSSQDRFNALRNSSRKFEIVGSFLIGAMVLDRIVAFIDARAYTRHLEMKPQFSASRNSVDLGLSGSF